MSADRTVQAVGNNAPVLESQLDHNTLTNLTVGDVHTQYAFLAGRAGGQSLVGGTGASDALALRGTSNADLGQITTPSQLIFESGWGATTPAANIITYAPTATHTGVVIETPINVLPTYTVSNGIFVYQAYLGGGVFTTTVEPNPVLSIFNLMGTGALFDSDNSTIHGISPVVVSAGPTIRNDGLGGTWVGVEAVIGMSFQPVVLAVTATDRSRVDDMAAVVVKPLWNTQNATARATLGNIRGIWCKDPEEQLFGQSLGAEEYDNYYGLAYDNLTAIEPNAGGDNVVVHSDLVSHAKNIFLRNAGGARSEFSGDIEFVNDRGVKFGTSGDWDIDYSSTNARLRFRRNGASTGEDMFFHAFTTDGDDFFRMESRQDGASETAVQVFELGFDRFNFGISGSKGNSFWGLRVPARTANLPGSWSDVSHTPLGALDIAGRVMTNVNAWTITPLTFDALGGGSIVSYATLQITGSTISVNVTSATRQHAIRNGGRYTQEGGVMAFTALSPAQFTGDVNDYEPETRNDMRQVWRIDTDGNHTLTGIAVQQDEDTQWITYIGSNTLILGHQDTGSAAANRIISPTGADLTLGPDESAFLWYDAVTDRWRILFTTGA